MAARDELKDLVKKNDYINEITEELAGILRESVRKGEIKCDSIPGFYVHRNEAYRHNGLLIGLGLVGSIGYGEHPLHRLTEKGIDLSMKLLEESQRTADSAR